MIHIYENEYEIIFLHFASNYFSLVKTQSNLP